MLVLSRKLNECVVVSDSHNEVCIKVVRISGRRVQLAIDAPIDVAVRRGELLVAESKLDECNLVNSKDYSKTREVSSVKWQQSSSKSSTAFSNEVKN